MWWTAGGRSWNVCPPKSQGYWQNIQWVLCNALTSSQCSVTYCFLQTDLQFAAPDRPGLYHYSVVLRSDSYLDLSFSQDIKVQQTHSTYLLQGCVLSWQLILVHLISRQLFMLSHDGASFWPHPLKERRDRSGGFCSCFVARGSYTHLLLDYYNTYV